MEIWQIVAILQQKIEFLGEELHALREEVCAQGEVFVNLQRVCTDIENSEE